MKLYSIFVFKFLTTSQQPILCTSTFDVSSFGFFQRGSVKEFMIFTSRTLAQRTQKLSKIQVSQNDYVLYSQAFDNMTIVTITDNEYNTRIAFDMLQQVYTYCYAKKFDTSKDNFSTSDNLYEILKRYQNPDETDKISRIKKDIDQTKIIMYDALDKILERGQKLEDLIQKSDDLTQQSKTFYKSSKKMNSCCSMM
jgi:synaptobrevin family protein YKT6